MSYILDALKKAERERGAAKVPTLTTVHDIYKRPRHQPWEITAVLAIILVAGTGFILYFFTVRAPQSQESPDTAAQKQETGLPQPGSVDLSGFGKSGSTQEQQTQRQGISSYKSSSPEQEIGPYNTGTTADSSARASRGVLRIPDEEMQDLSLPAQIPPQPEVPSNRTTESITEVQQAAEGFSGDASPEDFQYPTSDISAQTSALEEAMKGMNITILMYAENPADRLIFINGSKYVEGDYVDELYLIDSITQDGAVISYEGEKSTLKIGTN